MAFTNLDDLCFLSKSGGLFLIKGGQLYFQLQGQSNEDGIIDCQSVLDRQRVSPV